METVTDTDEALPGQPTSYKEMDEFINRMSAHTWLGLLGAYSAGGISNIAQYLKSIYPVELKLWQDKDLKHFFSCRNLSDFKNKFERI